MVVLGLCALSRARKHGRVRFAGSIAGQNHNNDPTGETIVQPQLSPEQKRKTILKVSWRLLPLIVICYLINYIDRTNI